ncbi:hypothetical protein [Clostridium estertheticum]|uniref:hypothetical protein n=1 Tax=Clostridium estertheticum TaxID=238834 RepID=UPI001C7E03CE|nr:hypothetical protein [Clostridium estertheticum]MBX4267172.1 hypothetical protein [Clostridium estertheticum]WLC91295.1 hypothetical protein KTC95_24125 [Clostridium estertheticum]
MRYNKEDYPELILVEKNSCLNNVIGYLPGDYKKIKCPKLIINGDIQMNYFRGYYWTDTRLVASNEGLVSHNKNKEFLRYPIKIVNSILKGLNHKEIEFNEYEIKIINDWYKDSLKFHMDYFDY